MHIPVDIYGNMVLNVRNGHDVKNTVSLEFEKNVKILCYVIQTLPMYVTIDQIHLEHVGTIY